MSWIRSEIQDGEGGGPDFVVDDPAVITAHDAFVVSPDGAVAAQGEFFAREEALAGGREPTLQNPRKTQGQAGVPFKIDPL